MDDGIINGPLHVTPLGVCVHIYPFTAPRGSSVLFLPAFLWVERVGDGDDE